MALIDEIQFYARAGNGGDGVVRWRREKFRPKGGPCGGDGGKGGDFIVEGVRNTTILKRIKQKDSYAAEDGLPGGKNSMHGRNGEDMLLQLPVGSIITNRDTGTVYELLKDKQQITLLKGGEGGMGNEYFKSSTNQAPMHATKGKEGERSNFQVELKLIADIGLVGLPNAGKTSLLNALTNAGARVGDYPFTTLDPNLGTYNGYVIADIPGIIEGASEGKGLGYKFLRHISRTSLILHCISLERDTYIEDYKTIRNELSQFPEIFSKKEYVVLTKSDMVDDRTVRDATKRLTTELQLNVLGVISVLDDESIITLGKSIISILDKS